jgi:hypothetical protein
MDGFARIFSLDGTGQEAIRRKAVLAAIVYLESVW